MKTAKARKTSPRTIAIAAYEGVSLLDLGGPLEAFRIASSFGSGRATYECVVVSSRGGLVKTADGIDLHRMQVGDGNSDNPRIGGTNPQLRFQDMHKDGIDLSTIQWAAH